MPIRITALTDPDVSPAGHRLVWLASHADGVPVGAAFLHLFTRTGQEHLATLDLRMHPEEAHGDAGSRLLDAAVAAARDHRRRRVIIHTRAGSPDERYLGAHGFRRVLTLVSARLSLPDADITALTGIIQGPHPGYRLASWDGMVPDELAETFVSARLAMNDTPTGGIDFSAAAWDLERVRAAAELVERQGDVLHTVAAVSEAEGAVAGYTELVVPGDGMGDARHYGTAVLPAHRGHGLSRWVKAEAIRHVTEQYPRLDGLLTDTADNNPYIKRVNDSLGYLPTHLTYEYQLDL